MNKNSLVTLALIVPMGCDPDLQSRGGSHASHLEDEDEAEVQKAEVDERTAERIKLEESPNRRLEQSNGTQGDADDDASPDQDPDQEDEDEVDDFQAAPRTAEFGPASGQYAVPASACQPSEDSDLDKIDLVGGVWSFVSGSGTVTLFCPLAFTSSAEAITNTRLWYRDEDGQSDIMWVAAELCLRSPTGSGPSCDLGIAIDSNVSATTTYNRLSDSTDVEIDDNLYFLQVQMRRSYANGIVIFTGLDITTA